MTDIFWLFKWKDKQGITHMTTDPVEANKALRSKDHPMIVGCRINNPLDTDFTSCPIFNQFQDGCGSCPHADETCLLLKPEEL